jgi:uncharacterized membrane protein
MSEPRHPLLTDHAVEQFVGRLLQIGVGLSALVVLAGGVLLLARHGGELSSFSEFHGEPEAIRTLYGIVQGVLALDSRSIIQFGLLMLIVTPILRVAFTWVAFVVQRDRVYIVITTIVLVLLLYGLLSGRG